MRTMSGSALAGTVNPWRKYTADQRAVAGPPLMTVASSPSPKPSCAGPELQFESAKPGCIHVTPGNVPLSS